MLASPDRPPRGRFARSTGQHNNDVLPFTDWAEGGALVAGAVTYPDLVDFLIETQVYDSEDLAWEFLGDVQAEVRRRAALLHDAYPFAHEHGLQVKARAATPSNAYAFCLLLSLPLHFKRWAEAQVAPASPARSLFERLVETSCRSLLPGWTVQAFGWSPDTPLRKGEIVNEVAGALHAEVTDAAVFGHANDAGIDILCHRPFADGWGGYPAMMLQCATGITNYQGKAVEPNLDKWRDAVRLRNRPKRALAVPFALDRDEMWDLTTASDGTVVDRIRLLGPLAGAAIDPGLAASIEAWTAPALNALPRGG